MDLYGTSRLFEKNPRDAIIKQIQEDFNLAPLIAKAYFEQIERYFSEHTDLTFKTGKTFYEAVSFEEPSGKPLSECRRVPVTLTLSHENDLKVLRDEGLAALRKMRIERLTNEAKDQGGLLSHEDICILLTTSPATVKRDIAKLRKRGFSIPTRGYIKDIGPGVSHKRRIVELYLKGYQFTEIERKTGHSEESIRRYLDGFSHVALLTEKGVDLEKTRQITALGERLILEYQDLLRQFKKKLPYSERLAHLLHRVPYKKGGQR